MAKDHTALVAREECCPQVLLGPLSGEEAAKLARGFAALGDPARLRLLSLVASADDGEVCVCQVTEPLGRSQPTVSHHLRVLSEAGLVSGEKRGRWVWYSVNRDRVEALRAAIAG